MNLPVGSYSFFNKFENCPYKSYRLYVTRDLPRVESPEMKRGIEVHTALEHRVGKGTPLPASMSAAEMLADKLAKLKNTSTVWTEEWFGITREGIKCSSRDQDVWFRGKIDVAVVHPQGAWIVDWKTGKVREEPFELETNALLLKAAHPEVPTIVANYFWLKTGKLGKPHPVNDFGRTYGRLQALDTEMRDYAASPGDWPKRKNPLCGWCPVTDCEHNESGRR